MSRAGAREVAPLTVAAALGYGAAAMGLQRARRSRGRHAVRLAFVAAALITLVAPALHSQLSLARAEWGTSGPVGPSHWDAGGPAGDTLPHDATTCPQCIAVAQARTLIQAPVAPAATGPAGLLHLVEPSAPGAPAPAAVLSRSARAPPQRSLSS